jgi:hypothetical protein
MSTSSSLVVMPDSLLAKEATDILREHSTELLFNHSMRVYLFAAEQGRQQKLRFDPELLYVAAAFHDFGLIKKFSSPNERFEVDGANAARQFLTAHNVPEEQIQTAWQAIPAGMMSRPSCQTSSRTRPMMGVLMLLESTVLTSSSVNPANSVYWPSISVRSIGAHGRKRRPRRSRKTPLPSGGHRLAEDQGGNVSPRAPPIPKRSRGRREQSARSPANQPASALLRHPRKCS